MSNEPARAFLLASLHEDPGKLDQASLESLDDVTWDRVFALASVQRVRPLVYQRLIEGELEARIPSRVWTGLREAAQRTARQNLRALSDLASIARALEADGIGMIVLKGAHLAAAIYSNPALREMVDVDVLVRREHLTRSVEVLIARGYTPLRPFLVESDVAFRHHITRLMKPGTARVEIHWNITSPNLPYSIVPEPSWRELAADDEETRRACRAQGATKPASR